MIKRIRIQNFKSLGDVTVDLESVTVLIGRSGTGKTNFVQALRFLRDYLTSRNDHTTLQSLGGWERVLCAVASRPVILSFQVRFVHPGIEGEYDYLLAFRQQPQGGGAQFSEEKLELGGKVLLHHLDRKWVQPPPILNPPAPSGVMLGSVTGVQEIMVANLVLTTSTVSLNLTGRNPLVYKLLRAARNRRKENSHGATFSDPVGRVA